MSGYPEQRRAVGEVVGATNCDPTGWLALLVDGDIVHVSVSGARVEQHERLPPPRSIPSAGVPR